MGFELQQQKMEQVWPSLRIVGRLWNTMEFKFENFGKAGNGTVRISDLSIICGPNNSGKTYINYAIYSILKNFHHLFDFGLDENSIKDALDRLKKKGSVQIDLSGVPNKLLEVKSRFVRIIGPKIGNYFQLPMSNFEDTEIHIKLNELNLIKMSGIEEIMKDMNCEFQFEGDNLNLQLSLKKNGKQTTPGYWTEPFLSQHIISEIKSIIFHVYFSKIVPNPFPITSERTGISLFYKAFDHGNKEAVKFVNNRINQNRLRDLSNVGPNIAEAIGDDVDFARSFENFRRSESFIVDEKLNDIIHLFDDIIDEGTYECRNNSIYYSPKKAVNEPTIPLESSSSSIKSFFLFDMFIRNVANRGDILVIDEPELNLHIGKQVEVAHLIARLINAGIKVLVSTHSDYFVREINNLIALGNTDINDRKQLMEDYEILENDLLQETQVSAFKTGFDKKIQPLDMYASGIDPDDWNELIAKENIKSDRIFNLLGGL